MPAAYGGAHNLAEKEEESEFEAEFVPLKAKFHKVVPVKEKEESDVLDFGELWASWVQARSGAATLRCMRGYWFISFVPSIICFLPS